MNNQIQYIRNMKFIDKIKKLSFVEKIMLFGSRAVEKNRQGSDIDLAVFCLHATPMQWHQVVEIVEDADTLLPIDCVRFDQAPERLQKEILKDGIVL